ncbi:MAG: glycine cleavage system aminomethyltransferase GcvT [Kiritimatiellia bacterium]
MNDSKLLRTPLNDWHRSRGAKLVVFSGWEMPLHYETGIVQEHLATRKFGGLFDISHMGRFRISGENAVAFLQHVLSNNVEALRPFAAQYTLIPTQTGGVCDDAYLYRTGNRQYLLVVNAANREKDWSYLQSEAQSMGKVVLEDLTHDLSMIAIQGPLSARLLSSLLSEGRMPEPIRNSLSEVKLGGLPVLLSRTGYTGEPVGFELFLPASNAVQVWEVLVETGKKLGMVPVGLGARDTLRLEAGLPLYGHELGDDPEGHEIPAFAFPLAGVAVSFSARKGNYIGRDALRRQFEELRQIYTGRSTPRQLLPRRFFPVALLERGVIRPGHGIFCEQRKIGVVTSGTSVPYWLFEGPPANMQITDRSEMRSIALAYLDSEITAGKMVEVEIRGRKLAAQIVRWHGRSDAPPYFRPIPASCEPHPAVTEEIVQGNGLRKVLDVVTRAVENHDWRQRRCMNLIPSEMTPSPLVRLLQVSDPVGRYAEHRELSAAFDQEVYYYQGTDFIAWVEERLRREMAEYLGCPLVEVRPVSGQMANMTVFSALVDFLNRFDRRQEARRIKGALTNHIGKGGHLSAQPMGALRDYVAKDPVTERYAVMNFPVCADNPYKIDLAETEKLLEEFNTELIVLGKSMVLHPEPVAEIRRMIAKKAEPPLLMYDMAHVLGLIGPYFQEPFKEGADVVTGSTHKTFFGTQRGVIGFDAQPDTPKFELWRTIRRRAFPGMVSNHHLGTLLGLLVATIEMNTFRDAYQQQVISNAKAFARALADSGLSVEGDPAVDYTETHQVIVNVGYAQGCEVARWLEENNVVVNYQALPTDESFTASSGLRMGVSEMTRFGMKEKDLQELAALIATAIRQRIRIADEVARLRSNFVTMHYCFRSDDLDLLQNRLVETF